MLLDLLHVDGDVDESQDQASQHSQESGEASFLQVLVFGLLQEMPESDRKH